MKIATTIARKCSNAVRLLCVGEFKQFFRSLLYPLLRIERHQLDVLYVADFTVSPSAVSEIELELTHPSEQDMNELFQHWPDSADERVRHERAWRELGAASCFLFREKTGGAPVHFFFLITRATLERPGVVLPRFVERLLAEEGTGSVEWVYTFEQFRRRGLSVAAFVQFIEFCKDNGIRQLYSRRGTQNEASKRMAQQQGYAVVAKIYQIQLGWQRRLEGWYLLRPVQRERAVRG